MKPTDWTLASEDLQKKLNRIPILCLSDSCRVGAIFIFTILPALYFAVLLLGQKNFDKVASPHSYFKEVTVSKNSFLERNSSVMCKKEEYVPLASRYLKDASVLVALNIRNGGQVLPHIATEILQLAKHFLPHQLFVSVLESGSTDTSGLCLHKLTEELNARNVRNRIIINSDIVRGRRDNRIMFLARIRNEVLEPLYSGNFSAKYVVFVNDVFLCASQIIRLLLHVVQGADMVCGLDYGKHLRFYDTWVMRDIHGGPVSASENCSIFHSKASMQLCENGKLVPVFSCWNGLVGMNAEVFSKSNIRFRSVERTGEDCPASECTLLCLDMWRNKHNRIYVDPEVKVAYDFKTFSTIFSHSNSILNKSIVNSIREEKLETFLPPKYYFCEPLHPYSTRDDPNRGRASWYPV